MSIENREAVRRYRLKKYGITPEAYDAQLAAQGGVCIICGRGPGARRLPIDHDHVTGEFRGITCHGCNTGMGMFNDDPALLRAAAVYLEMS